ncbi:MAG: phage holin family protein [Prolixibacteraceae bacterium]
MKKHESVDFFQDLKELVTDYMTARLKLLKIEVFEKTAKISASLFSSFLITLLVLMILFFLSIALGFYFGSLFNSYGTGFMIVTGLYLLLLIPFLFFGKRTIEKIIVNRMIDQLTENEEDEL